MIDTNGFKARLKSVNELLYRDNIYITLYVAGGIAISIFNNDIRTTMDIDVFNYKLDKKVILLLNEYDINVEISNVIKDQTYIKHSDEYFKNDFSNLRVFIANRSYLFVLKNLSQISVYRSLEKKEVDLSDAKLLLPYIDKKEVWQIVKELKVKTLSVEEAKYLKEEIERWKI